LQRAFFYVQAAAGLEDRIIVRAARSLQVLNRGVRGLSGIAAVVKTNSACGLGTGIGIGICKKCRKMAVFPYISALA